MENLDLASLSDAELIEVMQKLNIRFGPINPMTRKIYYKKIKAAKEGDSEQNWHLFEFFPWFAIFSQLKFSASLSGMEFSTDDEPESVSDRPSAAQNSKQNGHTPTQRPPKKKREMIIKGKSSKR